MNFANVTSIVIPEGNVTQITVGGTVLWKNSAPTPVSGLFYLTNDDVNDVTITITKSEDNAPTVSLEASDDGRSWTVLGDTSTDGLSFTIPVGGRKYLRSTSANAWGAYVSPNNTFNTFSSTGKFGAHGSVMDLLGYDELKGRDCYNMFYNCTSLTTAPELPATTLAQYCYMGMFFGCSSLTTAPELPATTLAQDCYYNMFNNCSSLTSAPELPATTLESHCYHSMFNSCSSLTSAPELPATTLASNCYYSMFKNCSSLTSAPELPATTLASSCYYGMFQGCTSLSSAPELPATTLASNCYYQMFRGCTSLTTPPPTLSATTLQSNCYYQMFYDCSNLLRAPILPATNVVSRAYYQMFYNCSKLNSITCYATTHTTTNCNNWLYGVYSTGIFYKAASTTWSSGASGIPSGWAVADIQ